MASSGASGASTEARQPRFFLSLRWAIIGILVVVELVFGLVLEPWADAVGGAWSAVFDRYAWLVRFAILGSVVWLTFTQLERIESVLIRQRDRIRRLYEASTAQQEDLQTLYQASLETSRAGDHRDVLRTIVEVAARLARARFGALAEFDEGEQVVEFVTVGVAPEVAALIGLPPTHRGLLARLSGDDAVRIDEVDTEPGMGAVPDGHPRFRAFLGVPVRYEGELLGHLYLADPEPARFTERDARMLSLFASQAAVAIGRARIDRQRRELLRIEEQRRVATELHDGALQSLYAVAIQLQRAQRRGVEVLTDTMSTEQAVLAIDRAMAAIRGELTLLSGRPPRTSAWEQLQKHVTDVAALYGVDLAWHCMSVPRPTQAVASTLASVLSELVANAVRHGGADLVVVDLACSDGRLEVRVQDDGAGVAAGTGLIEGMGLAGARRRLDQIGGELALSVAGRGVDARIVVPVGVGRA